MLESLEREKEEISWEQIENVEKGRKHLGKSMPVFVYRMVQYSIREEMNKRHGKREVIETLRQAGKWSGKEFATHMLDLSLALDGFVGNLQKSLKENSIGILRVERLDAETGEIILTISEDLDCSGLPVTGETVCNYAEGFLAGVLECYTGKPYCVKEIDCWATGSTVCRFEAHVRFEVGR